MKRIIQIQKTFILLTLIAALIGFTGCANNQKPEDPKKVAEEHNEAKFAANKEKDAQFLVNAAELNLKEIRLSQLAQQVSKMSDVKELGKQMEQAHAKSQENLSDLAKRKLITIPQSITEEAQGDYNKLVNKDLKSFDKEFCDMMVNGHKDALSLFEKASKEASDDDIRTWAVNMLPDLRIHLDQAITVQKKCEKM